MAGKEATVYILDLGASMGEKRYGRSQTDLEWALEYVWDKITTTVSKVFEGGWVVLIGGLGCDGEEDGVDECCWVEDGW